jgi:mannose-6-phosphate isomerase-like protein (cupin superfamily)
MEAFYAEFPTDAVPAEPHRHGSAEFIYVLSGRLRVNVEGDEMALDPGDSMYFDSSVPHSYRRGGKEACTALVVTAP